MFPHALRVVLASGISWYGALLLVVTACLVVLLAYTRPVRALAGPRWMLPAFFRGLGALLLLLLILKPEFDIDKTVTDPRAVVLLLDTSASMSLRGREGEPTRLRRAALAALDCEQALADAPGLVTRVVPFAVGVGAPVSGEDLLGLEAGGAETDIREALTRVARSGAEGPPLGRVVLLSDGNDTTGLDLLGAAARLRVPVDTVPLGRDPGRESKYRDVFLSGIDHRDSTPVGSVTQVVAEVDAKGYGGRTVEVVLLEGKRELARGELVLDARKGPQPVCLNFHPETPGMLDLAVMVKPVAGERLVENNTLSFPLWVHEKLPRVLYLEGAIRPDYKFLRRVLATDPGLEVMSLVRIRGDDFLRQGEVGGLELEGIPRTRAELSTFDVIILGDLPAAAAGASFLALLRRAVAGGTGLLVLQGAFSTGARSDYGGTPLAHVFCAVPARAVLDKAKLRPLLTDAGRAHALGRGFARVFPTRAGGPGDAAALRPLPGLDRVERLRPAATVLLAVAHGGERLPLLVVGRFGKGKTAVFLGHDAWRWSLGHGRRRYAQLWGQLVRWLGSRNGEEQLPGAAFAVTADRLVVQAGAPITFSASVRGFGAGPTRVRAAVLRGGRKVDTIGFAAVPALEGVFRGRFSSTRPGAYRVEVEALAGKTELGRRTLAVRVRGGRGEFERLAPNRRLLARMAARTGGKTLAPAELGQHAAALAAAERRRREVVHLRLWHGPLFFALLAACFSLEWILRKRAGLA